MRDPYEPAWTGWGGELSRLFPLEGRLMDWSAMGIKQRGVLDGPESALESRHGLPPAAWAASAQQRPRRPDSAALAAIIDFQTAQKSAS
jgi:hypothetical protein